ncbi:MAG: ATPase [Bacteroidaceae bacterium]|nr:ATPase [Bacteroidaceae bacterium]
MILVADSGSTKTDWGFFNTQDNLKIFRTSGMNPYHQSMDDIRKIVEEELLPNTDGIDIREVSEIHFYGAGLATPPVCNRMKDMLHGFFANAEVSAESDMLGAARALCGKAEGIACVLGTGSNSCLYDGNGIVGQIPSLGYILGDEGSSAALGKRLLSDCLKRQLPEQICSTFLKEYNLDMDKVLDHVYRQPLPNVFLASLAPFLSKHKEIPEIHNLLTSCFSEFFTRNVITYHHPWLPVHFAGSLAEVFSQELKDAADMLGMKIGNIMPSPISGLVDYHMQ